MNRLRNILIYGCFWLLFLSFPILCFRDMIAQNVLEWLWHPATLLYFLTFPAVFYAHSAVFLPRFFVTQRYLTYGASFILCTIGVLWLRPVDRLIFRGTLRFPPRMVHEHMASGRPLPPPSDPDSFFFDPTSLALFIILWLSGLGIWFYQHKLKLLLSALSKQMEAEAAALSETTTGHVVPKTTMPKVQENTEPADDAFLTVYVEYELVKIPIADIEYIEAFDSYIKIYLSNTEKPLLTRLTLRAIAEKLPPEKFVRIHRSFIVAADKAVAWTASKVRLKSGHELPVGRRYKTDLNL